MNEHWVSDCIGKIDPAFIAEADQFHPEKPKSSYFKKILIKWAIIFVGMALLLTALLLWPPRKYRLVQEDGNYYMYIDTKYVSKFAVSELHRITKYIHFDSMDAMEFAIRKGQFTAEEFYKLGEHAYRDGKIPLFNIDDLKEAVFPQGFSGRVEFNPDHYRFYAKMEDTGTVAAMYPVQYATLLDYLQSYPQFQDTVKIPVGAQDTSALLEGAVWYEAFGCSFCLYVITADIGTYYVREFYDPNFSEKIPADITVYVQQEDGTCFELRIEELDKRPDVAWLASFYMQDHK